MSTPQDPNPSAHPQEPTPAYAANPPSATPDQQQSHTQPTVQLPSTDPTAAQPTVQLPAPHASAAQPGPAQPAPGQAAPAYPASGQQPPAYGQGTPAYGQQPPAYAQGAPAYAQRKSVVPMGTTLGNTNTFAFLAILLAFIAPVAGIVFGHMGLNQIKRTGDAGRGIALTGLIIGYAWFAFLAVFMVLYVGFIFMVVGFAADSVQSYTY